MAKGYKKTDVKNLDWREVTLRVIGDDDEYALIGVESDGNIIVIDVKETEVSMINGEG